jgi:hypothetical protein
MIDTNGPLSFGHGPGTSTAERRLALAKRFRSARNRSTNPEKKKNVARRATRIEPISVGIPIHAAARIASLAGPGEVLVSGTTRDLLDGSGLRFADRGQHELKGLEGRRPVFALERD